MSHSSLANYYKVLFSLVHHHKYSISDIENLIPWERALLIDMVTSHVREEEKQRDKALGIQHPEGWG